MHTYKTKASSRTNSQTDDQQYRIPGQIGTHKDAGTGGAGGQLPSNLK